jgi:hypothetical protein
MQEASWWQFIGVFGSSLAVSLGVYWLITLIPWMTQAWAVLGGVIVFLLSALFGIQARCILGTRGGSREVGGSTPQSAKYAFAAGILLLAAGGCLLLGLFRIYRGDSHGGTLGVAMAGGLVSLVVWIIRRKVRR